MSDDNDRPSTGSNTEPAGEASARSPEVAELEADIARTRDELAQTVDQLGAKLDVKTRIRSRVSETRDAATVQVRSVRKPHHRSRWETHADGPVHRRWRCRRHRGGGPVHVVDPALEVQQKAA